MRTFDAARLRYTSKPVGTPSSVGVALSGRDLDLEDGMDHPGVAEGQGIVAQVRARGGVYFLWQQAQLIGETQQLLEQLSALVHPSEADERFKKPEGARHERALAPRQGVPARKIAVEERSPSRELIPDRLDCKLQPTPFRLAAGQWKQQQGAVQIARTV